MPLVMSLKAGQDFFVGDDRVMIGTVHGKKRFEVVVASTGQTFEITDQEAVEVMPDVFVSAGARPQAGVARVAIEAPQEITILRGDMYRGEDGDQVQDIPVQ